MIEVGVKHCIFALILLTEEQKKLLSSIFKQNWNEDVYSIITVDDQAVVFLNSDYDVEWMGRSITFSLPSLESGNNIICLIVAISS